jgi:maltose alpha-D-glucosyltransferase/alpha-amylase
MARNRKSDIALTDDPLWYKDAVIYQLHVKTFYDGNGDGVGDFRGLTQKLDYLQQLGVTALWLLPFYPSPLKDDGYDIADYTDVHPNYGTLGDFKRFLAAAHERGLRVITELAINHTSSDHPWFERARRAPPGSKWRDFYVWSDSPERYQEARIIFEDFESSNWTWDPVANAYYWHRFYSHQPDLNFDSPHVRKAVLRVLDFWMDLGVDGMRLDAVPYLYERDDTNCENLPETHAFLKQLRAHVDSKYDDRMLLAEANQWPEDAAAYFGDGDECHMNFHFPLMPRLFISLQLESRFPIVDILEQTPELPEGCQWALFLRNHDELTLEMVTDEDRDYMYRTYAEDPSMRVNVGIRRRLTPLLKMRRKVELLTGLLMSLPGTPVIYYGDEIGQGDNVYLGDRNGVRTPMQWSSDRNAGFSRANPQKLYLPLVSDPEYHYEALNVEVQQSNPESLLWWMKRLIAQRRQHKVFGRGDIEFLEPDNPKVLCFIRTFGNERVLVVANLARHTQYVELDLSRYKDVVPIEMAGGTPFPAIGELPYLLTLGGYQFLWFELPVASGEGQAQAAELPRIESTAYRELFRGRMSRALEQALHEHIRKRRWFRGKARVIKQIRCVDQLPLSRGETPTSLLILRVEYGSELPEHYVLPVAFAPESRAESLIEEHPEAVIGHVRLTGRGDGGRGGRDGGSRRTGLLYDPTSTAELGRALWPMLGRKKVVSGQGTLTSEPLRALRKLVTEADGSVDLEPWIASVEQSNSSMFFGHEVALKIFRQLESGENPDVEIITHLTERKFPNIAPVLATFRYDGGELEHATLGMAQKFVSSVGDCWDMTLEWLGRSFESALSLAHSDEQIERPPPNLVEASRQQVPESVAQLTGGFLQLVQLLGERTAELHLALADPDAGPQFKPEPFAGHYQRAMLQAARDRLARAMQLLRKQLASLPESVMPLAEQVLSQREDLRQSLSSLTRTKIEAARIRGHGDLHLGQVLYDGRDFVYIDFEGEPAMSMGVRRLKRPALYDVCGMLRSFHYAMTRALHDDHVRPEDRARIRPWAEAWHDWVCATYLGAYLKRAGDAPFVPRSREGLEALIHIHLLDKCAYELSYELNNRPDWVQVPLEGLRTLAG